MHIPDGFLATPVWIGLNAVSVPAVGYFARRAQREFEDTRVPMLGVMGAFVFAAQMINFPVGVGTSGHLVGSALLAVTLGPAAAAVVMTAVLVVQALVFQDGGVLALGANVLNMAIAGVLAGYLPYHLWGNRWRRAAIFTGGVLSVLTGALFAVAQLRLSGIPIPPAVLSISAGVFAVTAAIEGVITVAVIESIERLNPKLAARRPGPQPKALAVLGVLSVVLATVGVAVASASPDGLERMAERLGIAGAATSLFPTPLADYQARFLSGEWAPQAVAGLAGVAAVAAALFGLAKLMRRRGA